MFLTSFLQVVIHNNTPHRNSLTGWKDDLPFEKVSPPHHKAPLRCPPLRDKTGSNVRNDVLPPFSRLQSRKSHSSGYF